jgi:hypothetical protein
MAFMVWLRGLILLTRNLPQNLRSRLFLKPEKGRACMLSCSPEKTRELWQEFYEEPLTDKDCYEINTNLSRFLTALAAVDEEVQG